MSLVDDIVKDPEYGRVIFDTVPLPMLVVDEDVQILDFNVAAAGMFGAEKSLVYRRRGGEVLHCVHSTEVPEGCGHAKDCCDCPVRASVRSAFAGKKTHRLKARMAVRSGGRAQEIHLLLTASPFAYHGPQYVLLILENISELLSLRRLLPICAKCKRIRDDQEYWHSVENYFHSALNVEFTHGLCPDCAREMRRDW